VRRAHRSLPHAERAVLVAVEFTGERRKLTAAVRLARKAAAVSAGTAAEDGKVASSPLEPTQAADLDFDASLAEFEELARSAGAEIAATLIQRRPRPDPATLVGGGKLEEIEGVIASTGADLVLFDHDLSPSQLRNLEARLPCRVIDRRSWSINCRGWPDAERPCPNLAVASARADPVKRSWRPTAARSISASTT
jgi:GTP-binding protein HflX